MNTNDGGTAFPHLPIMSHRNGQPIFEGLVGGMSLRDYFAAKAMQGLLADSSPIANTPDQYARVAYKYADAMLAARENTP